MTTPVISAVPDPEAVRRQNELFDLYSQWPGDGDPDDDPDFVAAARQIMGLPPLEPSAIRSSAQDWEPEPDVEDAEAKARRTRQLALATRAAGHDVTPGHDELHHYWLTEGLPKWADSPKPWTTLVALLTRHVGPEKAKIYASRWFFEHFGFYAGSDLNRVTHGHKPRGHRVGPG